MCSELRIFFSILNILLRLRDNSIEKNSIDYSGDSGSLRMVLVKVMNVRLGFWKDWMKWIRLMLVMFLIVN